MVTLQRKNAAKGAAAGDAHGVPEASTPVQVEGRILFERSAFVAHSFDEQDLHVVEFCKSLLGEMGFRCSSGERPETGLVSEKVKKRILDAEVFIGIFTRRDKVEGKEAWNTAAWLIDEKSFAAANGKQLLLLKETGVISIGGLQGDHEYVEFDREALDVTAVKLIQTVWSLNPGRVQFSTEGGLQMSSDALEAAVAATPQEPGVRLVLVQQRLKIGQIGAAIREIEKILDQFPDYAPALHEKVNALRKCGSNDDAREVVDTLLKANPADAMAHHQLAHLLDAGGDIPGARREFERAQNCDPGGAHHFRCHGDLLFRTAMNNQRSLEKARQIINVACELGGEAAVSHFKGHLAEIERRLTPARSRKGGTRKKKN